MNRQRRLNWTTQGCAIALGTVVLISLTSCLIVPVKTPTQIKDASGKKTPLPTEAPVPGKTTRAEIETQYKPFAIETGLPDLFWGRFQKSSWFVIAGMYGGGGGAERTWGSYNLLATFDKDGVLKAMETVPDKHLIARFIDLQKAQSFRALDLSQPVRVQGAAYYWWKAPVELQLSATGVEVSMTRPRGPDPKTPPPLEKITVATAKVRDIRIGYPSDLPPEKMLLELRFTEKTSLGKSIDFTADPQSALTLVRWLEQTRGAQAKN